MPYKERKFTAFLKKNYNAKRNANPTLVYPGIRYAHKNSVFHSEMYISNFFLRTKTICG